MINSNFYSIQSSINSVGIGGGCLGREVISKIQTWKCLQNSASKNSVLEPEIQREKKKREGAKEIKAVITVTHAYAYVETNSEHLHTSIDCSAHMKTFPREISNP